MNGSSDHTLSATDRGLAYGDGLFETMLFDSGTIPLLSSHMQRLKEGCRRLNIPFLKNDIEHQWHVYRRQLLACKAERGIVKLLYSRGEGGQGYVPPDFSVTSPTAIFTYTPLQRADGNRAVSLAVLRTQVSSNSLLAGIKHLNRLEYVLAGQELSALSADSGLLLNSQGFVIEALHHNLFVVRSGVLYTPDLTLAGVQGIMRSIIIERLADECQLPEVVVCEEMTLSMLNEADEVLLCNSVRGIVPVSKCGSLQWSTWPITDCLRGSLSALWSSYAD